MFDTNFLAQLWIEWGKVVSSLAWYYLDFNIPWQNEQNVIILITVSVTESSDPMFWRYNHLFYKQISYAKHVLLLVLQLSSQRNVPHFWAIVCSPFKGIAWSSHPLTFSKWRWWVKYCYTITHDCFRTHLPLQGQNITKLGFPSPTQWITLTFSGDSFLITLFPAPPHPTSLRWVVLLIHEPRKQFDRVQMISDCAKLISKDESHIFSNPLIWRSRSLSVLDSAFIFQQFTTCLQHAAFQILSVIYVIQCRRRTSISNTITAKELAILFHETDQTRVYLVKIKIIL